MKFFRWKRHRSKSTSEVKTIASHFAKNSSSAFRGSFPDQHFSLPASLIIDTWNQKAHIDFHA